MFDSKEWEDYHESRYSAIFADIEWSIQKGLKIAPETYTEDVINIFIKHWKLLVDVDDEITKEDAKKALEIDINLLSKTFEKLSLIFPQTLVLEHEMINKIIN